MLLKHVCSTIDKNKVKDSNQSTVNLCESSKYIYFGLHNFATGAAHSAFWTAQIWLHCNVGICHECFYTPAIFVITWITTHLPTLDGWKAKLF